MLGCSNNRRIAVWADADCADLNGNLSPYGSPYNALYIYDEVNRIHLLGRSTNPTVGARAHRREPWCAFKDGHAPGNKRVWRGQWDGSGNVTKRTGASRCARQAMDELTYYSAGGAALAALSQRLVVYDLSVTSSTIRAAKSGEYYEYFGGPPPRGVSAAAALKNSGGWVNQDRLGSIGKFFPYGQERPSATSDGTEKFATYFRDSETGLDYAQNRYHDPGDGRFMTTDLFGGSAKAGDPGSWNRYAYVGGDPINRYDPIGLDYMLVLRGMEFRNETVFGLMRDLGCHLWTGEDSIPGAYVCGPESILASLGDGPGYYLPNVVNSGALPSVQEVNNEQDSGGGAGPVGPPIRPWSFVLNCFNLTVRDNIVNLGADVIGFFPVGVMAQTIVGFVDFFESAAGPSKDVTGAMSAIIGGQLELLQNFALQGAAFAHRLPIVAQIFNVVTTLDDIRQTIEQFNSCIDGDAEGKK